MGDNWFAAFEAHRDLLFSIAYRMLGSATDAEDLVQETFLRWQEAEATDVKSPKAFLSTVITRLCINHLKSARTRREKYVGPWLPEPLITARAQNGDGDSRLAESLSMAFLVLLESLSPVERSVFLLHEVFDYEYPEIAQILGKSEVNCRQVLRRARQHILAGRARFEPSPQEREQLTEQFLQVSSEGDLQGLITLLAADVALWSDGGGKASAALKPIRGALSVARFMLGALRKLVPAERVSLRAEVNGQPGVITYVDGRPISVLVLDLVDGRIQTVYIVTNPEKLAGLREGEAGVDREGIGGRREEGGSPGNHASGSTPLEPAETSGHGCRSGSLGGLAAGPPGLDRRRRTDRSGAGDLAD
jgi:RNA polymerase sigma-70 factor (ECF subfamily)